MNNNEVLLNTLNGIMNQEQLESIRESIYNQMKIKDYDISQAHMEHIVRGVVYGRGFPRNKSNIKKVYEECLEKIPDYRKELIPIRTWKTGRILRPSLYLFFQLKLARGTETDFLDCAEILKVDLEEKTQVEIKRLIQFVSSQIKKTPKTQT